LAWGVFFALTAFPGSDLVAATIIRSSSTSRSC
jgi:hypothetical protein